MQKIARELREGEHAYLPGAGIVKFIGFATVEDRPNLAAAKKKPRAPIGANLNAMDNVMAAFKPIAQTPQALPFGQAKPKQKRVARFQALIKKNKTQIQPRIYQRASDFSDVFIPPSKADVEAAIKAAHEVPDQQFENQDELVQELKKLLASKDLKDVAKAYTYACGRKSVDKVWAAGLASYDILVTCHAHARMNPSKGLSRERIRKSVSTVHNLLPNEYKIIAPYIGEELPAPKADPIIDIEEPAAMPVDAVQIPAALPAVQIPEDVPQEVVVAPDDVSAEFVADEPEDTRTPEEKRHEFLQGYVHELEDGLSAPEDLKKLSYICHIFNSLDDTNKSLTFRQKSIILRETFDASADVDKDRASLAKTISAVRELEEKARKPLSDSTYRGAAYGAFGALLTAMDAFESDEIDLFVSEDLEGDLDPFYDLKDRIAARRRGLNPNM